MASVAASVADVTTQALSMAERSAVAAHASVHVTRAVAEASAHARETVQNFIHDFYEAKKFDPYLRFSSLEDEQAYREREAANLRAIQEAQSQKTPEGDLEAAALARRQLADAGDHGADKSPDFTKTMDGLNTGYDRLHAAVKAKGGDTGRADAIRSTPTAESLDVHEAGNPPSTAQRDELIDVLATLRSAGVTINTAAPDQGHGLSLGKIAAVTSQREA